MKKTLHSLLLTSLTLISISSYAGAEECNLQDHNCGLKALRGSFSYKVSGDFNASPTLAGKMTEVGIFTSDGKGNITANAMVNLVSTDLSMSLPSGQASYSCTYTTAGSPAIPGVFLVQCNRTQSSMTPVEQTIDLILAKVTGSPTVTIEALSGGTFGNVNVSGVASLSMDKN